MGFDDFPLLCAATYALTHDHIARLYGLVGEPGADAGVTILVDGMTIAGSSGANHSIAHSGVGMQLSNYPVGYCEPQTLLRPSTPHTAPTQHAFARETASMISTAVPPC